MVRADFLVELRGFELRLLGNAFVDVWQFVGEPEGQGFDLRIPGCEVQIRSDNGPEVQCHLRGVPQEAQQSAVRQRILSLAELMAR